MKLSRMNKEPLVSVLITTYNRAEILKDAIKSVMRQSYGPTELVIYDDGSTDQTEDAVKSFQRKCRRRIVYTSKDHWGGVRQGA